MVGLRFQEKPYLKTVFLVFVSKIVFVLGIQPIEVAEPCTSNFITQDYDELWDHSNATINSTIYFPMTSKYAALIMAKNLFETQEFEEINEAQLERSCLAAKRLNGWLFTNLTGYNGRSLQTTLTPTTAPQLYRFNVDFPDVVNGAGYVSIALSDNERYNVFDICFDNGLRAFVVASTERTLDENSQNIIRAHMKSLGFKEKNFLNANYNACLEQDADGTLRTSEEDLPKPLETPAVLVYRANRLLAKKYASHAYVLRG